MVDLCTYNLSVICVTSDTRLMPYAIYMYTYRVICLYTGSLCDTEFKILYMFIVNSETTHQISFHYNPLPAIHTYSVNIK